MRVMTIALFFLFFQTDPALAERQIRIGNPTKSTHDLFFKPEKAKRYLTPPLRLKALGNAKLNLVAPGKYRTVLRSWSANNRYVDNTIGWVDFHRAYLDFPEGELQFEPYTKQIEKTSTVTVTKYIEETRTCSDGSTYTIRLPVHENQTRTHLVYIPAVRATIILPSNSLATNKKVDASKYISAAP